MSAYRKNVRSPGRPEVGQADANDLQRTLLPSPWSVMLWLERASSGSSDGGRRWLQPHDVRAKLGRPYFDLGQRQLSCDSSYL